MNLMFCLGMVCGIGLGFGLAAILLTIVYEHREKTLVEYYRGKK